MKRLIKILSISLITLMLYTGISYGAEDDSFVRIRIRSPRLFNEQAELDGYEIINVYDNKNGEMTEIFQIDSELSFLMDSYYNGNYEHLETDEIDDANVGPFHVKVLDKSFSSYEEAQNEINKLNLGMGQVYPYYNGENFEISIGAFTDVKSASKILSSLYEYGLDGEVLNGDKYYIVVYNDKNDIVFMYKNNYNIYFSSYNDALKTDMIKINNKPYRGMMGFYIIEDSKLISINHVELESYLYGVVPNEIMASWPIEAIKAQAVAARTYAVSNINPNAVYGYDMEDNQNSQVYRGYGSETDTTNKAVDETRGEMIYYDGDLIEAYYHSTSGGKTENSENIWFDKVPYLRGVEDDYSNSSPYTLWQKSATKEEIIEVLKSDGNDINELYGIEITKISENNRVMECIFLTDKGEITYKKEAIRKVLGYSFLMSSWFTIDYNNIFYFTNEEFETIADGSKDVASSGILDSIIDDEKSYDNINLLDSGVLNNKYIISSSGTSEITKDKVAVISSAGVSIKDTNSSQYSFNGRGYGHGIGMSQYGAKQMAIEGFAYDEILKHYYTGVNIQ